MARDGFGGAAETYDRSRPGYPPPVVSWLVASLGLATGRRVLDLAAGTGKLTTSLAAAVPGARLVAVEPVDGMRDVLRRVLPAVPAAAAIAERLPLRAASLDAVTVAQAFHWFDADAAFAELRRVLRPGGRVALVWNARDRRVAWVDALWSIMDRVERRAPWRDHERWSDSALGNRTGFGPLHRETFHHEQVHDPDGVVDRFAGVSHVAVLPTPEREHVLDQVREVLRTHPDTRWREALAVPYRVDAMWCERER